MGIKLKTKDELRKKPRKKSTKKQKGEEVPVADDIPSQTGADSEINECHTLPRARNEENKVPGVRSGKIKLNETEKRRVKNDKPATPSKRLRKTIKEKANLSPQRVPSDDGNAPPARRPSTSSSQEYDSEMSVAVLENNSDERSHQSYQVNSPKKNRRSTTKKGVVRRSRNRSKSKSPSRKENKNAEINSQNTQDNNDSPKVGKNTSKQFEVEHNRKETTNKQRRVGNKRSRSPINSDREENDSNEFKPKKSKKAIRKRSPVSSNKNKSPKEALSNSNNGDRNSRESSVDTRGVSPQSPTPKQEKHDTLKKKLSAEKSKKLDRSPSHVSKEQHNEQRENLSRGETEKKLGHPKSPRPISKIHKASSKPMKSLKSRLVPKSRKKKTFLEKKLSPRSKALPKKKALPNKRKNETRAKTKGEARKSVKRRIIKRKSVKRVIIRRKSRKSYSRRKK